MLPLARSLGKNFHIFAVEAPRPSLLYGRSTRGRSWYAMQGLIQAETGTFGDTFVQVERFLLDILESTTPPDAQPPPIFLLGYEHGASMALVLAQVWPDVLAGVVTVRGHVPYLHGFPYDPTPMQGLPVLFVHDPGDPEITPQVLEDSVAQLTTQGASVEVREVQGARELPESLADTINPWLEKVFADRVAKSASAARG